MRATIMYGAGDVRVEEVPDAHLIEPTDALVQITRAAICGSDLWPYKSMEPTDSGRRMGHEFVGVVVDVGADVRTVKPGDLVVSPFLWSDGTCLFCREGLHSECLHGGRYGFDNVDGGQGEAVRVPQADGTLVVLRVDEDDELMPSLLTLSDVMGTGHHAAVTAKVAPGKTAAVVGDGAVGLCGVIASKRLGADQVILLGNNPARIALGEEFGATDVVRERGDEAVERVRELTGGVGAHSVLECVGLEQALDHLEELHERGVREVLVCPVGFVADHLEIRWDLDHEATAKAQELGLGFGRIEMPNADPEFIAVLAGLVRRALAASLATPH
jgi:hypothetical protein